MKKIAITLLAAAMALPGVANAQTSSHHDTTSQSQQIRANDTKAKSDERNHNQMGATTSAVHKSEQARVSSATRSSASQKWRQFKRGERFERAQAVNYTRLSYRNYHALSAPPAGYVWVRSGNDALLVRLSNNLVSQVVSNLF